MGLTNYESQMQTLKTEMVIALTRIGYIANKLAESMNEAKSGDGWDKVDAVNEAATKVGEIATEIRNRKEEILNIGEANIATAAVVDEENRKTFEENNKDFKEHLESVEKYV